MTTLIIARHGNTFEDGETPRRVGARTDLPLVEKGRLQARALGRYLKANNLLPDVTYTSTLQRTQETAKLALAEAGLKMPIYPLKIFDEIDYGPDENQTEEAVLARIGAQALRDWEDKGTIPQGWNVNTQEITKNWIEFTTEINKNHDTITKQNLSIHEIVLVLTSNGIARFAPHLAENRDFFLHNYTLKLSTGCLGILRFSEEKWTILDWNLKPTAFHK